RTTPASLMRKLLGRRPDPIFLTALFVVFVVIACAIAPSLLAPYNPDKLSKALLQAPSRTHLLGTDEFGRDILSRIIYGARIELVISVLGVLLAMVTGIPLGLISGFRGGFVDSFLMRFQDALLAFPAVLFAILVVAAMGASQKSIILTVGVIYLPRF